ncbi:MAG: PAS domain-containing protein [Paracoccaceae bacterium]
MPADRLPRPPSSSSPPAATAGDGGDRPPGAAIEAIGLPALLDDTPVMVAVYEGPEHVCVYANAPHERALGHRPLLGRPLREAVPELAGEGGLERFDAVHARGDRIETPELGVSFETATGERETRWFHQVLKPWRDAAGAVGGVVGIAHDITAQVEARRLAERRRAELSFALEAGRGVGTWDWEIGAEGARAGDAPAEPFGPDARAAVDGPDVAAFLDAIHGDDRARVRAAIERAVATGEDFREEYRVPDAEGRQARVVARGRCFYDEAGRPTRFPGVLVDVTETVEALARLETVEAARATSEERHRRATAAGRVGTFEYYPRERRADWDAMTVAIFGFPAGEAVPLEAIADVVHPDDRPAWEAELAASLDPDGDGVHRVEIRVVRPSDGATRWIAAEGRTSFETVDDPGTATRREAALMLGTIRDVTERRDYEERLRLLNRELNHRVKNLFGVVQSLVLTSAGGARDVAEFSAKLRGRLAALAAAHLVGIADEQLAPVPLRRVVEAVLDPYDTGAVRLDGEAVTLMPRMATPIGLVLHELATNAAKHGALSHADGLLSLSWRVTRFEESDRLDLTWTERRPTPIAPIPIAMPGKAKRGFGTRLVAASVAQLGGEMEGTWHDCGLTLRIWFPLDRHRST